MSQVQRLRRLQQPQTTKRGADDISALSSSSSGNPPVASSECSSSRADTFHTCLQDAAASSASQLAHVCLPFADLCDDIIDHMLRSADAHSACERYRLASTLSVVSQSCRATLKPTKSLLAKEAALELIGRSNYHPSWETSRGDRPDGEVLDLSHQRIGTLECRLLALALSNGLLPHVRSLWLQDNHINVQGLRWLARGLRALPKATDGRHLRSVSLGHNPFLLEMGRPGERGAAGAAGAAGAVRPSDGGERSTKRQGCGMESMATATIPCLRAVEKLENAAAAQNIRVRLRS